VSKHLIWWVENLLGDTKHPLYAIISRFLPIGHLPNIDQSLTIVAACLTMTTSVSRSYLRRPYLLLSAVLAYRQWIPHERPPTLSPMCQTVKFLSRIFLISKHYYVFVFRGSNELWRFSARHSHIYHAILNLIPPKKKNSAWNQYSGPMAHQNFYSHYHTTPACTPNNSSIISKFSNLLGTG
jgi:hypothetical protein